MDDGNTCIIDEFVGEAAVLLGNFESPVRPDDGEASRRQPLVEPLPRLDIAGRNQQPCNFMQARIMADNELRMDGSIESTIKIARAGFGLFGTGMSKHHQTHGSSIGFLG